ncbi:HAD family hydrolase [Streptomyces fuscigenes]|uniref:HAD family hydrolase n=1 Tax=Streptomyces fuscigenes TaxID=1528880 RepID=UPI001F1D01F9|nr:HAD-IA family hydrolase [Streptomyces fuscigenes]MCF3963575.1 HAD-IA family hydrolase [Streptomyces fuscigenes]
MTFKAVLFDFSGTLFRIEPATSWLSAALAQTGVDMSSEELRRCAMRLAVAGALPGGQPPERVPADLADVWSARDESAALHRAAFTGLARRVDLPEPLYDALYERHMAPAAWRPYADTAEVLGGLRRAGIAVGVVSNIGWDLRPVFRAHGMDHLVDAFVLSFEHGIQKPDARLFQTACDELGQDPHDVLMVGDSREMDGGAAALGCEVFFVDHLPVQERPSGLRPVLALAGLGALS